MRDETRPHPTMVGRRRLGRTGLRVPEVGLGCARLLGRQADGATAQGVGIVRRALELGVTYLDTAECYIGGRSERVLGQALGEDRAPREAYAVATKFGHLPEGFDFGADSVLASLRGSLDALDLPAVDVFQVHTPPVPDWERLARPDGAFAGMRQAREEGLVRFLGVTGWDADFLVRSIETDLFDTVLLFHHFNAVDQSAAAVLQAAADHDTGVLVGGPLRGGLLGSARDEILPRLKPALRRRVEALESLAADADVSLPELATRFILSYDAVACSLAGPATVAELESSIAAAAQGRLPGELVRAIEDLAA